MPSTINGTGTKYYGARERDIGGTYITTLWLVVLGIPLLPLSSWRVFPIGGGTYVGTSHYHGQEASISGQAYQAARVPLNWRQILNVYLITIGIAAAVAWLLDRSFPALFR